MTSLISDIVKKLNDLFPDLLTPRDLSLLGVGGENKWAIMRKKGRGPKWVKVEERYFYRKEDVIQWLQTLETKSD